MEPVGSNSSGRSSRRRMLQMVGAAAAIPAFSSLGQASATLASPRRAVAHQPASGDPVGPMKVHTMQGGGGLRLHVREWGTADGPTILFIHGRSQSHLCWAKQYDSTLADEFRLVAYDLRGHGMSEAPLEPEHYTDGKLWADDIAAIIDQLGLVQPVLVGWSYGPFVICDYVRAYGQDRISAINFVEGAVKLGEAAFGTLIGPGFLDHFADATADDLPTNIKAMRAFVRGVRREAGAGRRSRDGDVLEHRRTGRHPRQPRSPRDRLRRRAAQRSTCRCSSPRAGKTRSCSQRWPSTSSATCPTSEVSWYEGVGHVPHLEEPERFNRELAALTRRAHA